MWSAETRSRAELAGTRLFRSTIGPPFSHKKARASPVSKLTFDAPTTWPFELMLCALPQQERAKLSFVAVGYAEIISRQQPREELLSQILGIVSVITFSANISIKRIPVSAAQLLERVGRCGRRIAAGRQDHAVWSRKGAVVRTRPLVLGPKGARA